MSVREWGGRVFVDLSWRSKRFSRRVVPRTIPRYRGVYVISSREWLYEYPRGHSAVAYIGSGRVADRLSAHVRRNRRLRKQLGKEGTMQFWYAGVPKGWHGCAEQALFDQFEERHHALPVLNRVRPPCDVPWDHVRVRHEGVSFPYDFSRRGV